MLRSTTPLVIGAAIYQINIFIGTILASLLPTGSVSYLYYADRIVELPLGVFAIAVGTATLPSFSEQVAQGRFEELKRTIAFSLRIILFITIPATVAMIMLRNPIISVLFQRGEFGVQSTLLTAQALLCYAVGLWAFSIIRIIVSAFYSLQDTGSPMKAAIVALIVNVVFFGVMSLQAAAWSALLPGPNASSIACGYAGASASPRRSEAGRSGSIAADASTAHQPHVPDHVSMPEFTWSSVVVGAILGIIFGASSLYLVLKVGLTVSASIPVAVISLASVTAYSDLAITLIDDLHVTLTARGEFIGKAALARQAGADDAATEAQSQPEDASRGPDEPGGYRRAGGRRAAVHAGRGP